MPKTLAPPMRPVRLTRALDALAARPWPALLVVLLATAFAQALIAPTFASWQYIRVGSTVLFSPQGLHFYALHPEVQMGPLTLVVSAPFVLLLTGVTGKGAAMVMLLVIGLFTVRELRLLLDPGDRLGQRRWLVTSAGLLIGWSVVAVHNGHVDDAFALASSAAALRLLRNGRPEAAALALGIGVDFKPWVLPFAAVLLVADRRHRLAAAAVLAVTVAVAWAPFFLADPHTVNVLHFRFPIDPRSTLRLLGVPDRLTPAWCRSVQFAGGVALAALAVRRGRWPSAVLVVVAFRLLLDPGVRGYYDAGLLLGAVLVDVTAVVPVATLIVLVLVHAPQYLPLHSPTPVAIVRTIALLALVVWPLVAPQRPGHALVAPAPALNEAAGRRTDAAPSPVRRERRSSARPSRDAHGDSAVRPAGRWTGRRLRWARWLRLRERLPRPPYAGSSALPARG